MKKILILGGTGMLGSMLAKEFSQHNDLDTTVSVRNSKSQKIFKRFLPNVKTIIYSPSDNKNFVKYNWIINAIGVIKPHINEMDVNSVSEAIRINSIFPYSLASKTGRIIQIATDCVFSDNLGSHIESDIHNPDDIYGKTKSLGEVKADDFFNIRCSIIGAEINSEFSLLNWFLSREKNQIVPGFTNHLWNGVTTLHFSKLCVSIILKDIKLPNTIHFIPQDKISKYELLNIFADEFDRRDIKIKKIKSKKAIDRTLSTNYEKLNKKLWLEMGYQKPLTIKEMVKELAATL